MCTEYLLGARHCLILNSPLIYVTLVTTPWSPLSLDSGFPACGDSLFYWQLLPHPLLTQWCPPGFSAQPCSFHSTCPFLVMWPLSMGSNPTYLSKISKTLYLLVLSFLGSRFLCSIAYWTVLSGREKFNISNVWFFFWGGHWIGSVYGQLYKEME